MVKLHQLAVFGCRLVVVYATPRDTTQGSVEDRYVKYFKPESNCLLRVFLLLDYRWGCDALKKRGQTMEAVLLHLWIHHLLYRKASKTVDISFTCVLNTLYFSLSVSAIFLRTCPTCILHQIS